MCYRGEVELNDVSNIPLQLFKYEESEIRELVLLTLFALSRIIHPNNNRSVNKGAREIETHSACCCDRESFLLAVGLLLFSKPSNSLSH